MVHVDFMNLKIHLIKTREKACIYQQIGLCSLRLQNPLQEPEKKNTHVDVELPRTNS